MISITDGAIQDLPALLAEVIPLLQSHPVPQSDARAKGLILQFSVSDLSGAFRGLPRLCQAIQPLLTEAEAGYFLAINRTPPTALDEFVMKPHTDRYWNGKAFTAQMPVFTSVTFIEFPADGAGGELVIFEQAGTSANIPLVNDRKNAYAQLSGYPCRYVTPAPGSTCRFNGDLPHAVLGYTTASDTWRTSIVLAAFL